MACKYSEIQLIADNPGITTGQISEMLNCDRTTVYRHIKKLRDMGIVYREGSDKTGSWKIVDDED